MQLCSKGQSFAFWFARLTNCTHFEVHKHKTQVTVKVLAQKSTSLQVETPFIFFYFRKSTSLCAQSLQNENK